MATTDNRSDGGGWAGWILASILAVIGLGLTGTGGVIYWAVVANWAESADGFKGIEGAVDWIFGLAAAGSISAGLLVLGICLRLIRWKHAALASLVLSISSVGFIIFTYGVFSDTNTTENSIEVVFLRACCIVLLLLVALPPFLHWWTSPSRISR